jgi:hypothetical protein
MDASSFALDQRPRQKGAGVAIGVAGWGIWFSIIRSRQPINSTRRVNITGIELVIAGIEQS